jgi:hypothetical protein
MPLKETSCPARMITVVFSQENYSQLNASCGVNMQSLKNRMGLQTIMQI